MLKGRCCDFAAGALATQCRGAQPGMNPLAGIHAKGDQIAFP